MKTTHLSANTEVCVCVCVLHNHMPLRKFKEAFVFLARNWKTNEKVCHEGVFLNICIETRRWRRWTGKNKLLHSWSIVAHKNPLESNINHLIHARTSTISRILWIVLFFFFLIVFTSHFVTWAFKSCALTDTVHTILFCTQIRRTDQSQFINLLSMCARRCEVRLCVRHNKTL